MNDQTTVDNQPLDGGLHPLLGKTLRELGWQPAAHADPIPGRATIAATEQTYSLSEVRNGTGWPERARFAIVKPGRFNLPENMRDWTCWDGTSAITGWRTNTGRFYAGAEKPVLEDHVTAWPEREPVPCPCPGAKVRVRYRDGQEITTDKPEWMRWGWTRPYVCEADIVAYKVLP